MQKESQDEDEREDEVMFQAWGSSLFENANEIEILWLCVRQSRESEKNVRLSTDACDSECVSDVELRVTIPPENVTVS